MCNYAPPEDTEFRIVYEMHDEAALDVYVDVVA
jgi:hypothetical protein